MITTITDGVLLLFWMGLMPGLTGCLWTRKLKNDRGNILLAYILGLFFMLALFEALALPMIYLKCSLTLLTRTWEGCVLALAFISVLLNGTFPRQRRWLAWVMRHMTLLLAAVILCVGLQAAYVTERQHIDDDDAFYLATSTTAEETDTLYQYNPYTGKKYKSVPARYVMASWPLFVAALSRLSGFHPAVLAHMLLPGIVVVWAYMIYALLAARFFPGDRRRQSLFLLFTVALLSFSGYSVYSSATFLFIRGWQGKAVLAGVGIPAMFLAAWMLYKEREGRAMWAALFCIVTGVCMFSTMGVAMSLVLLGSCALAAAVLRRQWQYLPKTALACSPALASGLAYAILRYL